MVNQVIVNQASGFAKLSVARIKGMVTVLKNLSPKASEKEKVWFIEIDKVFQEKNLKIFYLPLNSLKKLLATKQFGKLPDPLDYFVGITCLFSDNNPNTRKKIENKIQLNQNPIKPQKLSLA